MLLSKQVKLYFSYR